MFRRAISFSMLILPHRLSVGVQQHLIFRLSVCHPVDVIFAQKKTFIYSSIFVQLNIFENDKTSYFRQWDVCVGCDLFQQFYFLYRHHIFCFSFCCWLVRSSLYGDQNKKPGVSCTYFEQFWENHEGEMRKNGRSPFSEFHPSGLRKECEMRSKKTRFNFLVFYFLSRVKNQNVFFYVFRKTSDLE